MSDCERERDRDGGVNGISTGCEDGFTGIGGVHFARDHHAMFCVDRLPGGKRLEEREKSR